MRSPNGRKGWSLSNRGLPPPDAALPPLDWIRLATGVLQNGGVDAPRACAESLLAHALNADRTALYRLPREPLAPEAARAFLAALTRRLRHEPLQHIIGRTEFWSQTIRCDKRALVPRPETELAVEAALDCIRGVAEPVAADIGTGTGCVAMAIALERPDARVYAGDISPDALDLARENLRRANLADRVTVLQGDLAQPFMDAALAGHVHVVVCNPPYVANDEIPTLQAEVRDFDPRLALAGGADGLDFYRRLFIEAAPLLAVDGGMVLELGDGQAESVRDLARTRRVAGNRNDSRRRGHRARVRRAKGRQWIV